MENPSEKDLKILEELSVTQQGTMLTEQPRPEQPPEELRGRMEDLLRETENRFRRITQNARDIIFRMSLPDGTYEYMSPELHDMAGVPPGEGFRSATDLRRSVHPDYTEYFDRQWENLKKGEVPPFFEFKILHKDGRERWLCQSNVLVRDEAGSPVALEGVVTDITESKLAEEKSRFQHFLFAIQQETSIDGILIVDDRGKVLSYNGQFGKMWDIPPEVLETREDEKLLQAVTDKLAEPEGFLRRVRYLYEKKYEDSREEIPLLDGRVLDRYSAPLIGDRGKYYGRIWYFRDITDRKRMEEELRMHRDHLGELVAQRTEQIGQEIARRRQKEEQYQALVESIKEWIWETDANFVHTYLSPRVRDVLGYEPEELIGRSPVDIMPEVENKRAKPLIKRIISRKDQFVSFENVFIHKNGHLVHIEANGRPFFDEKGDLLGYRGSCHDITEKKKAMDELKERELELISQSKTLSEVNAALGVLLRQRERDREELEGIFVSNIREMVLPYILKIQESRPDPRNRAYLDIVATNLNNIVSPFLSTVKQLNFTPREIEVSTLIKEGRTTKEIAHLMGVATSAVDSHRDNIRKKLGLNNQKANLRSYLLSLK